MTDPRKISEKTFTAEVIKAAKIHGWLVAHFRPAMTQKGDWVADEDNPRRVTFKPRWVTAVQGDGAGFPDLVMVHDKKKMVIFAELKSEQGRLSPQQKDWTSALLVAGAYCFVWHPSDIDEIWEILSK